MAHSQRLMGHLAGWELGTRRSLAAEQQSSRAAEQQSSRAAQSSGAPPLAQREWRRAVVRGDPIYETSLRLQKWGGYLNCLCNEFSLSVLSIPRRAAIFLQCLKAHRPNGVCKRGSARRGYTPVNDTEWDGAWEFLEDTFLPALGLSIGGNNVTATRARLYATWLQTSWRTVWLDWARIQFRFLRPSSFNTALQLVLRPHFLVHFV
jgi:hypothetical protein